MLTPARATRDLRDACDAIAAACGVRPTAVRPPYGVTTPAFAVAVRRLGLAVVGWSVRSWDTVRKGEPATLARRLAAAARPGSIVLLHDAPERQGGREPLGPRLVAPLVAALRARGLEPVTVSELLETDSAGPGSVPRTSTTRPRA
jgi:peptidoglycan/xylan/chitin deacetylase (PgdA/CDA1 family)